MSQAVVRDATPAEVTQVAAWFAGPEEQGLAPDAVRAALRDRIAAGAALRVLTEGTEILAAALSRRVVATLGDRRVDLLLVRGGAPETGRRNAALPILLRGVLRQEPGAVIGCLTSGGDAKALAPIGFRPWASATVTVSARALPRIPAGARVRPAAGVDLAGLAAIRDAGTRPLRVVRTAGDWQAHLDRWAARRTAGAQAPEAVAVLRDDSRLAYAVVQPDGDALRVLEAGAAPGGRSALLGALGATARGRKLAKVVVPAAVVEGVGGSPAPTPAPEPTFGAPLETDLELTAVEAAGDPLSGVDRL